ncbi:MAG: gamma-glutamyltransferase [Deinococcales bacterium]
MSARSVETQLTVHKSEVAVGGAAVAAMQPLAARVGADVLRDGGNAVDAAIATAFALSVVEPFMSGPLGHGGMLVALPDGAITAIDFVTRAPHALAVDDLRQARQGAAAVNPAGLPPFRGPKSVSVPSAVFGLLEAHHRFGTLELDRLLAPSIRLASDGFEPNWYYSLVTAASMEVLLASPEARDEFLVGGRRPPAPRLRAEGPFDRVRHAALAATYQELTSSGPDSFRAGPLAERISDSLREAGSYVGEQDLRAYQPSVNRGMRVPFRGYDVIVAGDTSGGPTLAQALRMLDRFDPGEFAPKCADYYHLLAEVQRSAFLDRFAYLGDPDATGIAPDVWASDAVAAVGASALDLKGATPDRSANPYSFAPAPRLGAPGSDAGSGGGDCTTHTCVVDRERMTVSLTVTYGRPFGSGVMVPDTGLLTANILEQFALDPAAANAARPWCRPVWNGAPVVVERAGHPIMALGAPGSKRIPTALLQVLWLVLGHGLGIQRAIETPRVHCEGDTTVIDDRVDGAVIEELGRRGHRLSVVHESFNSVNFARPNGILIDSATGMLTAGADEFRMGHCVGVEFE